MGDKCGYLAVLGASGMASGALSVMVILSLLSLKILSPMPLTNFSSSTLLKGVFARWAIIASALAWPTPFRLISSSLLAVLIFTAANKKLAKNAITAKNFIGDPLNKMGDILAGFGFKINKIVSGDADSANSVATLSLTCDNIISIKKHIPK